MKFKIGLLCTVFAFFIACGGSSDDSSTNDSLSGDGDVIEGSVDETAEELAVAAQDTTSQILSYESDPSGYTIIPTTASGASASKAFNKALAVFPSKQITSASSFAGDPIETYETSTEYISEDGPCGGTLSGTTTIIADDENIYPFEGEVDWSFDEYCHEDEDSWIIFNGNGYYHFLFADSENGTSDLVYDISYTSNIIGYTSGSCYYAEHCITVDGDEECSVGVTDIGTATYYTSDVSVSGDATSGYDISYYITDSDGNAFYIEFTDLIPCDDGGIGSGYGTVEYDGGYINIEFTSCDEFVVTYNGISETFDQ